MRGKGQATLDEWAVLVQLAGGTETRPHKKFRIIREGRAEAGSG